MAKKKNSKPLEKPKQEPVNEPTVTKLYVHAVSLIIGSWKNQFPELQCKLMIAKALNECVYKEEMSVAGYLITGTRVCLVLERTHTDINKALWLFFDCVRKEIRRYREQGNNKSKLIPIDESAANLFTKYPLVNNHLIRLLTGRPVKLRYYDPHLARLKDKLRNSSFCSLKDYKGAHGPVIVKVKK